MSNKSYARILVKDHQGNQKVCWERPLLGDLVVRTEGGRTIIEKIGFWGDSNTYMPSDTESVEATS